MFKIITDGSCDLSPEIAKTNNISVVPFYVTFDGTDYKREGVDIDVRDFYQQMVDSPKTYPKSSLPTVNDYIEAFLPYVKENIPVICICITTKFSGSFNSASSARCSILEEYPEAEIAILDSTVNTVLQGNIVLEAAKMQQAGYSYEETINRIEDIKASGRIFFTIGSIDYLREGGRIGRLKGLAADVLGIKPLILLKEGEIFQNGITRSRTKGMLKLVRQLLEYFKSNKDTPANYSISIGYGYDKKEAEEFRTSILEALKEFNINDIPLIQIGATIAVHTGPYAIGIGVVRRYDAPEIICAPDFDLERLLQKAAAILLPHSPVGANI